MTDGNQNGWPEESCIQAIKRVAEDLGESPTRSQYEQHHRDYEPSVSAICNACGSWNEAKQKADLEIFERGESFPNYRHAGKENHSGNADELSPDWDETPVTVSLIHDLTKIHPDYRLVRHTAPNGNEVVMIEAFEDGEPTSGLAGDFVSLVSEAGSDD